MTLEEWNSNDRVLEMLEAIPAGAFSRELLSFTVSVCQRMEHLLTRELRDVLMIVEAYVDGNASRDDVIATAPLATTGRKNARVGKTFKSVKIHPPERAAMVVESATSLDAWEAAKNAALACDDLLEDSAPDLLRQAIQNPFASVESPSAHHHDEHQPAESADDRE